MMRFDARRGGFWFYGKLGFYRVHEVKGIKSKLKIICIGKWILLKRFSKSVVHTRLLLHYHF